MTSCVEEMEQIDIVAQTEVATISITTTLSGRVTLIDGQHLRDYDIHINDNLFNVEGDHFIIETDEIKKEGQLIKIEKEGRFVAWAYVLLHENDINVLSLHEMNGLNALTLSKLELSESLSITAHNNFSIAHFPFSQAKQLGRSAFSLDGNQLYLQDGFEAFYVQGDASFDIVNTSDRQIFEFDFERGYFQEAESETNLSEGIYIIANTESGVYVEGKITQSGDHVSYANYNTGDNGLTLTSTHDGYWMAHIPLESQSAVQIFDKCNQPIYNAVVSGSEGIDVPESVTSTTIATEVIDCDAVPQEQPAIVIENSDEVLLGKNSALDINLLTCEDGISIQGYDTESEQGSISIDWGDEEDNLLVLTSCEQFDAGYSYVTINGNTKIYEAFELTTSAAQTILTSQDESFKLFVQGDSEGVYAGSDINLFIDDANFDGVGYFIDCQTSTLGCGIENLNITHYDADDEGIFRASFSGTVWILEKTNETVAGNFPIEGVIVFNL